MEDPVYGFLAFVSALGNSLGASLEDKKLDFSDIVNLWSPISKAPDAFNHLGDVWTKLSTADEAKLAEYEAFLKTNFDIPEENIEVVIESAMDMALGLLKFLNQFKKK